MSGPPRRRDHGSSALEVVVLTPLLLLVASLVLQAGVAVWATSQTTSAARAAGLEQSRGGDGCAAGRGALPEGLRGGAGCTVAGESVALSVRVPRVSPLPVGAVERAATFRGEP